MALKIEKPALKFTSDMTMNNDPKYIIIHHAASSRCTIEDIHSWHLAKGWAGCGYHFFVNKAGKIFEGRPIKANGAHTVGQNTKSIGICLEGDFTKEKPSKEQIKALQELVAYLQVEYDIDNSHIKGHSDFNATLCPAIDLKELFAPVEEPEVDLLELVAEIEERLSELKRQIERREKNG